MVDLVKEAQVEANFVWCNLGNNWLGVKRAIEAYITHPAYLATLPQPDSSDFAPGWFQRDIERAARRFEELTGCDPRAEPAPPAPQPVVTYEQLRDKLVEWCGASETCGFECHCKKLARGIAALYGTPIPPVPPADPVAELEAAWATLLAAETAALRDYERVKAAIAAVKAEWGK